MNHQSAAVAAYELRGRGDRHVFLQYFRFIDWPDQFYGIGNANDKGIAIDDGEGSTRNYLKLKDNYLQLESEYQFQVLLTYISVWGTTGAVVTHPISSRQQRIQLQDSTGVGQLTWSGLMPLIAYDTRDKLIWPTQGLFVRTDAMVYRNFMGSDFDAELYRLDARWYKRLFKRQVLALRTVLQRATGDVPLSKIAGAGRTRTFSWLVSWAPKRPRAPVHPARIAS